ncbi:DUF4091 domain-containing protein [Clostridiales bacterium COT073_COT-073]|nr:DUF4091 domain-containing protein [Clostridiales bacterium COT073_COT-073]
MLQFQLISGLEKIFADTKPQKWQKPELSGLYGETLSFQIAYYGDDTPRNHEQREICLKIKSPLQAEMNYRLVGLVPSNFPAFAEVDENYITDKPGLFPDVLLPISPRLGKIERTEESVEIWLRLSPRQWRALWIDIELNTSLRAGVYPIEAAVYDHEGRELWQDSLAIEVIPAVLPKQKLLHTEWFHADCLADYYGVPVFSERHWQIMENFVKTMVKHGINTLLTPIFTPPLDTMVGGERTTVQLVGVIADRAGYRFDFSRLEQWLEMAFGSGIEYIEISHLFSQWGAKYAPKIMAEKDGKLQKIFGWENEATGQEYQNFLHAFLPELTTFLEAKGLKQQVIFHISDEPHSGDVESYMKAKNSIKELLHDYYTMDALSTFEIYQSGIIEHPVVATDHIQPYLDNQVEGLWAYYCCSQKLKVANRFMAMPSARNRILGVQLYKYNIKGFLHWGYNFYNSQFSLEKIDPYFVTDAGEAFPSGDAFLVYPGENGQVIESIRLMVLSQAIQDLRAFQLLESLAGKDLVMKLIEGDLDKPIRFDEYPKTKEYLLELRAKVNQEIKQRIAD